MKSFEKLILSWPKQHFCRLSGVFGSLDKHVEEHFYFYGYNNMFLVMKIY